MRTSSMYKMLFASVKAHPFISGLWKRSNLLTFLRHQKMRTATTVSTAKTSNALMIGT